MSQPTGEIEDLTLLARPHTAQQVRNKRDPLPISGSPGSPQAHPFTHIRLTSTVEEKPIPLSTNEREANPAPSGTGIEKDKNVPTN